MADDLEQGDKVEWNAPQGRTHGKVEQKLTSDTKIKRYEVKASKDDPKFLVKSDKSGSEAAHRADALDKK